MACKDPEQHAKNVARRLLERQNLLERGDVKLRCARGERLAALAHVIGQLSNGAKSATIRVGNSTETWTAGSLPQLRAEVARLQKALYTPSTGKKRTVALSTGMDQ